MADGIGELGMPDAHQAEPAEGIEQAPMSADQPSGGTGEAEEGQEEEAAQHVEALRSEFLSKLSRQAEGSSDGGAASLGDQAADAQASSQRQQIETVEDFESGSEGTVAVDGEEEEEEEEDKEDFGDAISGEEAQADAGQRGSGTAAAADKAGFSTSTGPQAYAVGLADVDLDDFDLEDLDDDAFDNALQPGGLLAGLQGDGGAAGGGDVVGGNLSPGPGMYLPQDGMKPGGPLGAWGLGAENILGGILGGIRSAAAAAGDAAGSATANLRETLGRHVKIGQRTGVGLSSQQRQQQMLAAVAKKDKKQTARAIKRQEKKDKEKLEKQALAKRERVQRKKDEEELGQLASSENIERLGVSLKNFAAACERGDCGGIHLQISDLFSETNQIIVKLRGLPLVPSLPWKPLSFPDFFDACFVLCIRATGSIQLVNEIERLAKEHGQPLEFVSLLSVATVEGESAVAAFEEWKKITRQAGGSAIDKDIAKFIAKRALVHEWIEKGYTDVMRKALSLAPLCIQAPEEPPLVTALRQGHSMELVSLLIEPVVRRRTHKDPLKAGVDQASPTDGATAIQLAVQKNRMDVLREILKYSSRWTMLADGKSWTPLCYALAQGRAAMVPLLLAHAKRSKPDAADLAEYVNEVCDNATALHRAVAANAPAMVRLLLECGACPAVRTKERGRATSPLHLAAARKELRPLLEGMLGCVPSERRPSVLSTLVDGQNNSLLHVAVAQLDVPLAELLLGMGARPTSQSEDKSPLLKLLHKIPGAAAEGTAGQGEGAASRPGSAGEGEQGADSTAGGSAAPAAGTAAAGAAGDEQALQLEASFLRYWELQDTAKALHPAQKGGSLALLRGWLLRQRAHTLDPLLADPGKRRALGQAAVDDRNVPLLKLLLKQPGFTAQGLYLHRLIGRGTLLDLLQRLLDAGASVHECEPERKTPLLHRAAEENDLACLNMLLSRGAAVDAVDADGNNALHAVAGQKERVGVFYTAVVARLYEVSPQLVTKRNAEFFLPSDRAPAGSAVDAQLEALTKRQLDAAKVAEEAERWERAAKDLSLLGPPTEEPERKRQRVEAMLASKLALTVQNIQRQERLGVDAGGGGAGRPGATSAIPAERRAVGAPTAGHHGTVSAPRTPAATSIYRQRPRKRNWADLADELPVVVRMPVWPESLEAAAAAARADPAAAVAQILQAATPEGAAHISSLSEMPWEMDIHKNAWAEWMGMEARHRCMVLTLLLRIAAGGFEADPLIFRRVKWPDNGAELEHLEVFVVSLPKSASVIFEVAPEVDVRRSIPASASSTGERHLQYHDILRVWYVSLEGEERVKEALDTFRASYRKGLSARHQLLLEAEPLRSSAAVVAATAAGARLPRDYRCKVVSARAAAAAAAAADAQAAAALKGGTGGSEGGSRLRKFFPPASTEADSYTVLKFHPLEDGMLHAVMTNEGQTNCDFKFRLSPEETDIIERVPQPPQSLILLGRSGTGKTTCAVFRVFDHWRRAFEAGEPLHQVFVTVSATLKEQVAKAFVRLRNGLPAVTPDRAAAYASAAARPYHSFRGLPEEAWPLFLSAKQYLHMLDGTLRVPFFKRRRDGGFYYESEAKDDDDGMSLLVDLAGAAAAAAAASGEAATGNGGAADSGPMATEEGARIKVTFSYFQSSMFRRLVNSLSAEDRRKVDFNAGLAWQEIVSYIKGTKQAVEGSGRLSEEEYLNDVGRKQAPNFGPDSRRLIYQVFIAYEAMKKNALTEGHVSHFMYDQADSVAHMHRQLRQGGFRGEPIHELYCDEVQDFTQAELLLGLRVVSDPNGLFLCGDTCQTIARGIGFRFTDVKQLFYQEQREAAEQKKAGGQGWADSAVQMPDIVPLEVNYRTHSGVLDVAASVVQLLRRFFADHIDDLKPEQAFLEAPHLPMLLPAATPGNVAMLLAGGDANEAWKTEFGANQVVLRRSMASQVPPFLAKIDAVVMTVPQAKGLEFNDVFILNFFADSPCKEEWRVLMQYLAELEERQKKEGPDALPFGKALGEASEGELGMAGARLDPLPFDESQHKLLCEELKHLYTAVTRAKNAVVFFDSDPVARAPFYFYLARLGLAKVVAGALQMAEGKDLHQLGLSNAKSTPADWIRRAQTMVRTRNFEAAATCYRKAGNSSRAQACQAQAKLQAAAQEDEVAQGQAQAQAMRFDAGYTLLAAAVNAPTHEADAFERREWLLLAAAALKAAGQETAAARISAAVGPVAGHAAAQAAAGGPVRGGPVHGRG